MEISGIYDNGPISPVARIQDNLSIYTTKKWFHYRVIHLEPWPRSSPLRVEMVAGPPAAANIAANGTIAKRLIPILQVTDGEMLHVRFEPLDDVEGIVYEQPGTGKFISRNTHARVDMASCLRDPYLAGSTFFILGFQRDMNLEVRNPNPIALFQARFQFRGYRYVIEDIVPQFPAQFTDAQKADVKRKLDEGNKAAVAEYIGPTTWLPAEGR